MPGLDKTGPRGCGPMTGRGAGTCRPDAPENENNPNLEGTAVVYGVGRGGLPRGCGMGRCSGGFRGRRSGRW